MTGEQLLLYLHYLSLFYMVAGLGAVMIPLWRGWREEDDLDRRLSAFEDATNGHRAALLPGTIAVGATGVFLAGDSGYNFFTTGWLLALELLYLLVLFMVSHMISNATVLIDPKHLDDYAAWLRSFGAQQSSQPATCFPSPSRRRP